LASLLQNVVWRHFYKMLFGVTFTKCCLASLLQNVVCPTLNAELGTVVGNIGDSFIKREFKKFS